MDKCGETEEGIACRPILDFKRIDGKKKKIQRSNTCPYESCKKAFYTRREYERQV